MKLSAEQQKVARMPDHFTDPTLVAYFLGKRAEHSEGMLGDLAIGAIPMQYSKELRDRSDCLAVLAEEAITATAETLTDETAFYLDMISSQGSN